ncbi:MAG: hypothetical protein ICV78_14365 [Tolypothrix sp. Co-bin9]|nr:hypothetical protein [Tolypothrix sp. Co-bin9]
MLRSGDSRRTDRAIAVGAAIAANPEASLPNIMSGWNEVRAANATICRKTSDSHSLGVFFLPNFY